jgi:hypothetical protein
MSNMKRRCLACNPQKIESIKVWIWFEDGYAQYMHNTGKIRTYVFIKFWFRNLKR